MAHCDMRYFAHKHLRNESAYRHWSPESESYPPAEVLLQFLRFGWVPDGTVTVETFYYAGYRSSDVYHFTLKRGSDTIEIPVLANPAVFRVVDGCNMPVVRINTMSRERISAPRAAVI